MLQFFVLYKDEYGEKFIAEFNDYGQARQFYLDNQSAIAIMSKEELIRYITTSLHI